MGWSSLTGGGDSGCRDCRRVGLGDMGSRVLTSRHLPTLVLAGPSWKSGHEGVWREGGWVVSTGVCPGNLESSVATTN